jgi:ABC-type phosphate transport system substrate-binding protein
MFFKKSRQLFYPLLALLALTLTLFTGCVQQTQTPPAANLSGQISIDGSSNANF